MLRFVALVLGTFFASALSAQAAVFTDRASFEAANPGLATIDFEGIAPPGDYGVIAADTYAGVNLSSTSDDPVDITIADSGMFFNTPTDAFFIDEFTETLVITFDNASAAGFNVAIGFGGFLATIQVFDGATLLDSEVFQTAPQNIFTSFIGFSYGANSITEIRVTPELDSFVLIDDLSFGNPRQIIDTPAPAAGFLFAGGLLALAGMRRRR